MGNDKHPFYVLGLTSCVVLITISPCGDADTFPTCPGSYVTMNFKKLPGTSETYNVICPQQAVDSDGPGEVVTNGDLTVNSSCTAQAKILEDNETEIIMELYNITKEDEGRYCLWPGWNCHNLVVRDISTDVSRSFAMVLNMSTNATLANLALRNLDTKDLSSEQSEYINFLRKQLNITANVTDHKDENLLPWKVAFGVSTSLFLGLIAVIAYVQRMILIAYVNEKMLLLCNRGNNEGEMKEFGIQLVKDQGPDTNITLEVDPMDSPQEARE